MALVLLMTCGYLILGNVVVRLLDLGRISIPSFVRIVPYQVHLVYVWPQTPERPHQE